MSRPVDCRHPLTWAGWGLYPICPDTGNKLFLMPADPMYFLLVSGFETVKSAAAPT